MSTRLVLVAWLTVAPIAFGARANAQTFEVVRAFTEIVKSPGGRLLEFRDGVFYGTAANGGLFGRGAVFILARNANGEWTTTPIHSFNGSDGAYPVAGLVLGRDGNLYGTTPLGGANDFGTVYRMTPLGAVTVLHSFNRTDGLEATTPLVQAADGSFWGTTQMGIYQITASGGFRAISMSGFPTTPLIEASDGNLYGVASYGGALFDGSVYRVTPSGTVSLVHEFAPDGVCHPVGGLVQAPDGFLYGVTSTCDASPSGTVFKTTTSGDLTVLHQFTASEGVPYTLLTMGADGSLYGVTGSSHVDVDTPVPSVFRVDTSGAFTIVTNLGSLGAIPAALTAGADGLLYGTMFLSPLSTTTNKRPGFGSAYAVTTTGSANLIHAFTSDQPVQPIGRLLDDGGSLYGTSSIGGLYGYGTVFRLASGVVTTLHSFSMDDGAFPIAGLVRGPDGAFYGTTFRGGPTNDGTVFRITAAGEFTVQHAFNESLTDPFARDGGYPFGRMALANDGNLYGAASSIFGGNPNVFRITPAGTFAVVRELTLDALFVPVGNLVAATDDALYGTAYGDPDQRLPDARKGSLFRVTLDGSLSTLYTFDAEHGNPSSLVQANDGKLYGSSETGGALGAGFIFKSTLAGAISMVHQFNFLDGSAPTGELVDSGDGGFYGTTSDAGGSPNTIGFGTVFKMSAGGAVTTLHRFAWLDGAYPIGGLTRASDGSLYGTTRFGTLGGGGTIFRITQAP